jgi:hypothetical protein
VEIDSLLSVILVEIGLALSDERSLMGSFLRLVLADEHCGVLRDNLLVGRL